MARYLLSIATAAVLVLCVVLSVHAYRAGDVVRIEKRSQYNLVSIDQSLARSPLSTQRIDVSLAHSRATPRL